MNKIKFIVLGLDKVGKTTIIFQLFENIFNDKLLPTVGDDKSLKEIEINHKKVKIEICDTPGAKIFSTANKIFMRNSKIALIVYDITDERSFEELNYWIKEVKEINKNEELIIGIAANKCDLYEYQEVSFGEGVKFAKDNNCLFYITSAKDHDSIENAFEGLTRAYIEQIERKKKYFK